MLEFLLSNDYFSFPNINRTMCPNNNVRCSYRSVYSFTTRQTQGTSQGLLRPSGPVMLGPGWLLLESRRFDWSSEPEQSELGGRLLQVGDIGF